MNGSPGALDAPNVSREELLASMPPPVRAAFPPFDWSEEALWRLRLPVEEVPIETFDWLLDLPLWRWRGRRFQISVRDVLDDPARYHAHWAKAERADLRFPIHVAQHRGRWVILDGYHRLMKALSRGGRTIRVVKVSTRHLEQDCPGG